MTRVFRHTIQQIGTAAALLLITGICLHPVSICRAETNPVKVTLETRLGTITLQLYENESPITVANFLAYVDDGFYDGTLFHRVMPGFVIQGGGLDDQMRPKATRDPIVNEAANGLKNTAYTVAMARTTDPNSATSQFFINLVDNAGLDYSAINPGYAVFGEVIEGKTVVDAIAAEPTTTIDIHQNMPVNAVVIQTARRVVENGDDDKDGNGGGGGCFLHALSW